MAKFKVSDNDKATLAANIKRLRMAKNWSQDELAFRIGADRNSQSTISHVENGKSQPLAFVVFAIAQALGTTVEYLMTHGKRSHRGHAPKSSRERYEAGLLEINGTLMETKTTKPE